MQFKLHLEMKEIGTEITSWHNKPNFLQQDKSPSNKHFTKLQSGNELNI